LFFSKLINSALKYFLFLVLKLITSRLFPFIWLGFCKKNAIYPSSFHWLVWAIYVNP
jgi:hypothetical protein